MSVASMYEFKDKETNVGIKQLTDIAQNAVYTASQDLQETLLGLKLGAISNLDALTGKLQGIVSDILNIPAQLLSTIKAAIDRAIDFMMNLPFVGFIKDLLDKLKAQDEEGVRQYLVGEAQAGNWMLCNNLDVIQGLINGIEFPESILDGIFMSINLNWLNRSCKDITPEQERAMSNQELIENAVPYRGVELSPDNVMRNFMTTYSGRLNDVVVVDKLDLEENEIISQAKSGNFNAWADSITPYCYRGDKEKVIAVLSKQTNDNSPDTLKILKARGRANLLPIYGSAHVAQAQNTPRSSDALGSVIKNLSTIDLTSVPTYGMTETEKVIYEKLYLVKGYGNSVDFLSRTHAQGQFMNFNFEEIDALFSKDELDYMKKLERSTESYRYNNLKVTTEMFVDDSVPRIRKKDIVNPGTSQTQPDSLSGYVTT